MLLPGECILYNRNGGLPQQAGMAEKHIEEMANEE